MYRETLAAIVLIGFAVAVFITIQNWNESAVLFNGMISADKFTAGFTCLFIISAGLTLLLSLNALDGSSLLISEFFALIIFATVGMILMAASTHLLTLFLGVETLSVSLYILIGFRREDKFSLESSIKYFLLGAFASGFLLYGIALVYGSAGSANLKALSQALSAGHTISSPALLTTGLALMVAGFGFKIALVPFHLWAPDAYQGAPTPSAALVASGSKVASFFILARVMALGFAGAEGSGEWRHFLAGWMPVLAICAALSMLLGNLAAIVQTSVKRLLAYSAIAHAGYMILGVMVTGYGGRGQQALAPLLYYAATYALTSVGAFGVVMFVENKTGNDKLASFAGLCKTAPFISFCMMIFMLSLAGIPPLAGFVGKFYLFTAAVAVAPQSFGLLWLVVLAIGTSAVSLYYYLQVLKQIYVVEAPAGPSSIHASGTVRTAVALAAGGVLFLGCVPSVLLDRILNVIQIAGL
jgi:NADH-quinone oxidoreductase subunit N